MIRVKSPKPEHPGKVAHGLLALTCIAGLAFAFPAVATAASEADEATQQMRKECDKMSEEMKGGGMSRDEEMMSSEMKEMHRMCATMMHDADQHRHHGEGRQ